MIERIVAFSLRQRFVILVAALLLVLVGADAVRRLPIEAYPDVADTWVQVIVQWPGHAPEEVERMITIPTERAMAGVAQKRVVRSTTVPGLAVITLLFDDDTDTFFARQQVDERLGSVDFPADASVELGPVASPTGEILRYRLVDCSITQAKECGAEDQGHKARSLADLKDLEEFVVEREITTTPGVADVVSFGGLVRQYQVLVDPVLLASHGLTLKSVEDALRAANGNAGGGVVNLGSQSLNVRGVGLLGPEQIANVPLTSERGTPVRVRHVGKVVVGHQPRLGRVSVDDDLDVVAATVLMRKGQDTETVLAALHTRIDEINDRVLPRGVKISPYHDRTQLLEATTHTVMKNLLEGIVLVTLVLFVFLGNTRAALVVAVTIPLSLFFAFACLGLAKVPANLLSMGALDFGMIVDGSIVMVENIHRRLAHKGDGKHPPRTREEVQAVVAQASREVSRPIVFALGIIVTSYLPILLLQRVEGKLFRPLAITVGFALVGALLLAVTVIPVLASYLLVKESKDFENPLLRVLRRAYLPALKKALAKPRRVLGVGAVLLVATLGLGHLLGTEFLPHLDEGAIWMRITMPTNISRQEAEMLVDGVHPKPGPGGEPPAPSRELTGVREMLREYPEVRTLAVQIGRPDDGTDPIGFYNAEFLLVLKDKSEWRSEFGRSKDALIASMAKKLDAIPGVVYGFSQPISDNVEEALTGVKGQLAVKIVGDDLQALDDLADSIARSIASVPGVRDLGVMRQLGQSNIEVQIARDRAERYGLSVEDVEDAVEHGIGGVAVTKVYQDQWYHDLVVRFSEELRSDIGAIRKLLLPTEGGHLVPLTQVGDVVVRGGASRIFREGGRRALAIKFEIRGRDLGSTIDEAQAKVAAEVKVPAGYEVRWEGEFESARRAGNRLKLVVPVTLTLIFVLLFILFRQARDAVIVLGNVLVVSPLGGIVALLIMGHELSVSSAVGFLALFGVSVQTGVLLISFVDELRAEGLSIDEAILQAAELRLRPIVMTAMVATLGLVPAALSTGIGSDSQKPLAIVVVGGLFSSLALSLFTLPLAYKLWASATERRRGKKALAAGEIPS